MTPEADQRIAFWRYRHPSQGYRGYHLAAAPSACRDLLRQIAQTGQQGVDLALAPLTDAILAVPNSRAESVGFTSLRIELAPGSEAPIRIEERHPRCTLALSDEGARQFSTALERLAEGGEGDFTIGSEGQEIWFWPWPKRA